MLICINKLFIGFLLGVVWSPRIGKVGMITQCPKGKCSDSTRIRVDSAGLSSPYGRDPVVYTNPNTCGETVGYYDYYYHYYPSY